MGTDSTKHPPNKHLVYTQPLTYAAMKTTTPIIFTGLVLALVILASALPAADPEAYADPEAHRWGYRRPSYSHYRPSYSRYRPSYSRYRPSYRPNYNHRSESIHDRNLRLAHNQFIIQQHIDSIKNQ